MLPQEEEIEWMDEVEVLKDKDLYLQDFYNLKHFLKLVLF